MRVWRLASARYAPLTGEGARLAGGRWNSPGVPLVYTSSHLSLAVLELLVHVDVSRIPEGLVAFGIDVPDDEVEELDLARLSDGWRTDSFHRGTREIGDGWAREGRSLGLVVPSAVVPGERNVLLNPLHPAAVRLRIAAREPFSFDARLLGRTSPPRP